MPLKQDGKYVLNSIGSRAKVCHRPTSFQPANKEAYTWCTGPCRLTRLKQCMHMHVCHPWSNSPAADRNPTALIVVLRYHALMARMWSASLSSFVRASNSMPKCNLNKHEDDHARYEDLHVFMHDGEQSIHCKLMNRQRRRGIVPRRQVLRTSIAHLCRRPRPERLRRSLTTRPRRPRPECLRRASTTRPR